MHNNCYDELLQYENIYLIGACGVSMNALGEFLILIGKNVTGTDLYPHNCKDSNITIYEQNGNINIPKNTDLLIYTTVIADNHPDIIYAKAHNIKIMHRTKLLDIIIKPYNKIFITGMSGKTSSSFYIHSILDILKISHNSLIGEKVISNKTYHIDPNSNNMIVELNEGDMNYHIDSGGTLLVTNIIDNPDHIWLFNDYNHLIDCYKDLFHNMNYIIYCYDFPILRDLLDKYHNKISFGYTDGSDLQIIARSKSQGNTDNVLIKFKDKIYNTKCNLIGKFSILNVVGAILAIHINLGIDIEQMLNIVSLLKHPTRRLDKCFENDKITIFNDQGLHPFEVLNSIEALRESYDNKPISVFLDIYSENRSIFKDDFLNIFTKYEYKKYSR